LRYEVSISNQLKPIQALVRLLCDDAQFRGELCAGTRPACCAIIRSDRSSTPRELIGENSPRDGFWQMFYEFENSKCKTFRSLLQFVALHLLTSNIKLPLRSSSVHLNLLPQTSNFPFSLHLLTSNFNPQTSNFHHSCPAKKGLCTFSSATVVMGP